MVPMFNLENKFYQSSSFSFHRKPFCKFYDFLNNLIIKNHFLIIINKHGTNRYDFSCTYFLFVHVPFHSFVSISQGALLRNLLDYMIHIHITLPNSPPPGWYHVTFSQAKYNNAHQLCSLAHQLSSLWIFASLICVQF